MQVLWKYDTTFIMYESTYVLPEDKIRNGYISYEDKVETFTINNVFMICRLCCPP
jgi:hypothetical protein